MRISRPIRFGSDGRSITASGLLLTLIVAGCGSKPADPFGSAPKADRIECRTGAAVSFERACVVERSVGKDGLNLTIRHRDGGFRHFLVTSDGRGVVVADGAEAAIVKLEGNHDILVTVGDDSYRLPATVKAVSRP
jgi:hypothetical protein